MLVLLFISGMAALIYQVLWMKELGLLFGNTAQAAATTLCAFFLGLALGGYFWGQRAIKLENPLHTYGLLELAAATSVVGYFFILDAYHEFYPVLFAHVQQYHWVFVLIKFLLALILLFPPAFFLGGTLPVVSQFVVRNPHSIGLRVSLIYGINTAGAAIGALLAGFYLPKTFGYTHTYWAAMACTATVGLVALFAARRIIPISKVKTEPAKDRITRQNSAILSLSTIKALVFLSGFGTLCLQVLWTSMFAQVLQNSVYTYASIVVVFLLFLAVGAWLSHYLVRRAVEPNSVIFLLLIGSGVSVAATPFLFNICTEGLRYVGINAGWHQYLFEAFKLEIVIMALPLSLLGAVFPYLIKIAEPWANSAGGLVGRLIAWNTFGAILGSLFGGFVILEILGLTAGIRFIAMLYLVFAIYVTSRDSHQVDWKTIMVCGSILLLVSVFDTSRLPVVRIDPVNEQESLLQVWESANGIVAVIRQEDTVKIKVNNYYTLGGSGSRELEELEGFLPILLHPHAQSVFFLGLGTGISAGGVLRYPVKRLTVAELIPDVINASRLYFGKFNNHLFYDPRARVINTDGRNYLAGKLGQYDVITADLFVPWRSGVGSLYTLEHYQSIQESLREQGLFMQWLPAYQLSNFEILTIAHTMTQAFPQVTLWRGDFSARKPVIGLLGQVHRIPLSSNALIFSNNDKSDAQNQVPTLAHYAGNLNAIQQTLDAYPINTDDQPIIEYRAPVTQRQQRNKKAQWLVGNLLIQLMQRIQANLPFENDPYLSDLDPHQRLLPRAGLYLHRSQVDKQNGYLTEAEKNYAAYKNLLNLSADKSNQRE